MLLEKPLWFTAMEMVSQIEHVLQVRRQCCTFRAGEWCTAQRQSNTGSPERPAAVTFKGMKRELTVFSRDMD